MTIRLKKSNAVSIRARLVGIREAMTAAADLKLSALSLAETTARLSEIREGIPEIGEPE